MNAYLAFLKKEFYDYLRSYKLFVLMMVFLALGFLNPISARYLLEVAASLLPDGIQIQLPQPEVMDSWAQFYKNIWQIGIQNHHFISEVQQCFTSMDMLLWHQLSCHISV